MDNSLIKYINRETRAMEIEKIYGDSAIRFFYQSTLGKVLNPILASKFISQAYGLYQDFPLSARKVAPFVKKFNIKTEEYEKGFYRDQPFEFSFKNFNEFFIRKFQKDVRNFSLEKDVMPAFCEARYYAYESHHDDIKLPVKGSLLRPCDLIGKEKWAKDFQAGPIMVARLCPVDYHRYHYPDEGETLDSYTMNGKLDSVNPIAFEFKPNVMINNERRVSILETKNFGKLAYIEVGATCVGKIVQSHDEKKSFNRGDEKGYFLFGGSTVILIGEKGKWCPSKDLLTNTSEGIETLVKLGSEVGFTQATAK